MGRDKICRRGAAQARATARARRRAPATPRAPRRNPQASGSAKRDGRDGRAPQAPPRRSSPQRRRADARAAPGKARPAAARGRRGQNPRTRACERRTLDQRRYPLAAKNRARRRARDARCSPASVAREVRRRRSSRLRRPSAPAPPATRRASVASGVISAARRPGVSMASRIATASASASSVSVSATISATPSSPSAISLGSNALRRSGQRSVVSAGRNASLSTARAASLRRRRRGQLAELRVARCRSSASRRRSSVCGCPAAGPVRRSPRRRQARRRRRRDPCRDRAARRRPAARARSRRSACAVARLAPVEPAMMTGPRSGSPSAAISRSTSSAVSCARSIRPRSSSHFGQASKAIFRNCERDAPIGIEGVGDERLQPLGRDVLDDHVVDQRGEVLGERKRLRRTGDDQRRLALVEHEAPVRPDAADRAAQRLAPFARQRGERHPPREIADRGPLAEIGRRAPARSPRSGSNAPSGAMRGRISVGLPLARDQLARQRGAGAPRRHDRSSRAPDRADRRRESPESACPPSSARLSAGRKGAPAGRLKTLAVRAASR